MRRKKLFHLHAGKGLVPHADERAGDVDARKVLGRVHHSFGVIFAVGNSRHAGDVHHVALAADRFEHPFGQFRAVLDPVNLDVVRAGLGHAINRNEDYFLLACGLDDAIERRRRNREGDDGVGARLDHPIDLLDLALRVGAGGLHAQFDFVAVAAVLDMAAMAFFASACQALPT